MKTIQSLIEWQAIRHSLTTPIKIGFVPTMGNLHAGHISLYERSLRENDYTVASLFVNPTQFNESEDFTNYPRTQDADLKLLETLGVDYCLLPDVTSLYNDDYRFQIHENNLSLTMEGAHRPGHFTGVLTVVMKLLNLVKPHRAYFGEKDYQQYQLIRDMAASFFMDIEITPCPTVREASGLAYSSRNNRLDKTQRQLAENFAKIFHQPISTKEIIAKLIAAGIEVDYVTEQDNRRFAAVKIDDIRLIDNYAF